MDISALLSPSDDSPNSSVGNPTPTCSSRPTFPESHSNSTSSVHSGRRSASIPASSTHFPGEGVRHSTAEPVEERMDEVMADATPPVEELRYGDGEEPKLLEEEDYEKIAWLLKHITDHPYQYDSHVKYIALLHRGFRAHLAHNTNNTPYPFFMDLRDARQSMVERFPMKESMWLEWIVDEKAVAGSMEEKVFIVDLCIHAVSEEKSSVKLWRAYAEYMEAQYLGEGMSEEGRAARVFTPELFLDVYRQGAQATMNNISESHEIWNKHRDLLMRDLELDPSLAKIDVIRNLYKARLRVPHSTLSDTFSAFSTFVTKYDNSNYESTMVATNKLYSAAAAKYAEREPYELRLKWSRNNPTEEWKTWAEYLDYESSQPKKKLDVEMACALYERCLLQFGEQARVWEEYVYFVIEKANTSPRVLALLKRATRHCPWSGTLWAQYIIALEKGFKPFEEVSDVKHRATKTGMLDLEGMEEVLKVNTAWCGFLKRRALEADGGEDDFDMAEMGISEAVTETGKEDPEYRLQRIHINFFTLANKFESARTIWKELAKTSGDSWEFWLRYYQWELTNGTKEYAGAVLNKAVARGTVDWPEKILESWKNHIEDYGNVKEVEEATIKYRKVLKAIALRRSHEAQLAASQQQVEAPQPAVGIKRRRSIVELDEAQPIKKSKSAEHAIQETPAENKILPVAPIVKRDRENLTVIVKNLPQDYTEVKVRQYFRDCGAINSLNLIKEHDGKSSTATIEFDNKEDVLAAETKHMKNVEGHFIEVQVGTGSTLYVTNFPPAADEQYIRSIFKDCGDIVDVRFPSLKYNTHRRFCYVQFVSSEQAQKATQLDGMQLGDKETLVAKISAPNQKKERSGAIYDGREVYVRNIDFRATEQDVRDLFSKYGKVERVRLPPGPKRGTHKGFGFVIYSTKEEAEASIGPLNGMALKSRNLDIQIAQVNPSKHKPGNAMDSMRSMSPASDLGTPYADAGPPPASGGGGAGPPSTHPPLPSFEDIKRKTLGVMNLCDTINDTKVRTVFEKYGPLRKLTLRPDHEGAIVEFETVADAAKATLALDGTTIGAKKIAIGTLADLMRQKPPVKVNKGFVPVNSNTAKAAKGSSSSSTNGKSTLFAAPPSVRAGAMASGRVGRGQKRRAGLGFSAGVPRSKASGEKNREEADTKKDGDSASGTAATTTTTTTTSAAEQGANKKSNADFKAMYLK